MKTYRKRKLKPPLLSGPLKTFENELNLFVKELSKNNHYAAFLYEQILRDLKKLAKKTDPGITNASLTSHCLPINSEFKFLPLQIYLGDPNYDLEIEVDSLWLKEGKDQGSLDLRREEYYAEKKSRIIRKIFDLSRDFSLCIEKIHKDNNIPVHSLTKIYSVITSEEKVVPLFQDGFQKEWVLIPNHISVEQRDRDLSSISRQIYNLLVECFFVSIVSGMEDSLIVFTYLDGNDFQKAQKYLLDMACYLFMEEKISSAGSIDDLKEHAKEELNVFHSFLKPFHNFFEKYAQPLIKRGVSIREKPFIVRIDPSSVQQGEFANYADVERIQKKAFKVIFDKGSSKEEALEDHEGAYEDAESEDTEDEDENTGFAENEASGYEPVDRFFDNRMRNLFDPYLKRKTKRKTREKEEEGEGEDDGGDDDFKHEKEGFFYEMLENLMEKWRRGLVFNYELQGNPLNLISFLEGIFSKIGNAIMGEDYNEQIKRTEGISLRTDRRYEKEKKEGKIDKDLSIDDIWDKKRENRKHHVPGYWTLNQLLKELVDRGQGTRTTLMRKIKKLLELKKIQFSKEDGIYRFEASEENLNKIIKEISKL
jgi:hypothetical protein